MNKIIEEITTEVGKVPELALFSHVSPDGDCIGSMLALGFALEKMGKKVYYYNHDPIPDNLRFLPGVEKISNSLPTECPQTLIFIDCAEANRAGGDVEELVRSKTVINIDHHISNDLFGELNWVDSGAAATGEMIYYMIKKMGVPINEDIAVNLYTAIVTDTGRFSFSNTTAQSFRTAAELVEVGIDLAFINNILFEQKTLSQIKLLYKALANLQLLRDGKIAVIVLSRKDFEESGAEENLSEGLVNYARNIESVEAAVLLKELSSSEVKVSFRSNFWLDVNKIAQKFGGGGHIRASGCTLNLPLKEAKEKIVASLEEALNIERDN